MSIEQDAARYQVLRKLAAYSSGRVVVSFASEPLVDMNIPACVPENALDMILDAESK